jgi:hypothetical protein
MELRLLLLTILFSTLSWGQAVLPVNRTVWNAGVPVGWTDSGTGFYTSTFACSGSNGGSLNDPGDYYQVFFTGESNQLSYTIKISGVTTSSLLVQESVDGAVWTTIVNHSSLSTTCTTFNHTLLTTTRYVKWTYTKVGQNVTIDDVNITALSLIPNINVSSSSLSGMVYVFGAGPSTEQTFDVSGSNLTTNITLTAPVNYEISTTSGVGFTNNITLPQSGGNVATTAIYVRLKAGLSVATYNGEIISCSSTGATTQNVTCNGAVVNPSTVFEAGDFAVIALNSNISCFPPGPNGVYGAGDDEISFITFRDIQNGDTFYMTDNGFERVNANEWGDSEGTYQFTRTGAAIPAGTVITFRLLNASPFVEFNSPDVNWAFTKVTGFTGSLVMNSGGDQVIFMQGGVWNNPVGTHDATYTPGTFLYAFNTNSSWTSFGTSTQQSGLPFGLSCFSLMPGSATDYLEYTGPTTATDKLSWIARLNNPANWTDRTDCASYTSMHVGQSYTVTTGGTYVDGVWVGSKSTDWFDCGNWQTLKVPDATINVDINATYAQRDSQIDITSPNAPIYSNLATANDVSVSDRSIIVEANPLNVLEVYGNLLIGGTGALDMDDGNVSTVDGTIHLYGNWTNSIGESAFSEGNGTVHFDGVMPQIISNVSPEGTEVFYDVVMNNNFTTNVSNNLIASGDLIVNTGRTVTVNANNYVQIGFDLTVNGTLNVLNNGSLVQVDDSGLNTGNISYQRSTTGVALDYVYWSSPVNGVNTPSGVVYSWSPTFANPNGGQGYWIGDASTTMQSGVGYIMRDVFSRNFVGTPNNGIYTPTISRGSDLNAGTAGPNGTMRTITDDNWNLLGNPYPSALSINSFLTANTDLDGFVRLWTHGTSPSTAIADPFYDNFVSNYTASDYIAINGAGATSGPGTLSVIGGGQAFFTLMNPGTAATSSATFNNSMRNKGYSNSQFYRTANTKAASTQNVLERHRIWLDLQTPSNETTRTLVAYVNEATNLRDRMYDAITDYKSSQNLYTLIGSDVFTIQGRASFVEEDRVPVGFKTSTQGTHTISIAFVDGLFENNQNIFLEDTELNVIHDLRQAPYSFYALSGIHNSRFILRYTDSRLSNDDNQFIENGLFVVSNENIQIISNNIKIKSVEIFDVLGRKLISKTNVDANNVLVNEIVKSNNALIVNITLENNIKISRKILF